MASFHITLKPVVALAVQPLALSVVLGNLTINGETLDLTFMQEGDVLPIGAIEHPLLEGASISLQDGVFFVEGMVFHLSDTMHDQASCFPEAILLVGDGDAALPLQVPAQGGSDED